MKGQNEIIFGKNDRSVEYLVEEIKIQSWKQLTSKATRFRYSLGSGSAPRTMIEVYRMNFQFDSGLSSDYIFTKFDGRSSLRSTIERIVVDLDLFGCCCLMIAVCQDSSSFFYDDLPFGFALLLSFGWIISNLD